MGKHKEVDELDEASDASASAASDASDASDRKKKKHKSKGKGAKKGKKEGVKKGKKDKKDKKEKKEKGKKTKRGPHGAQWKTWDKPFQPNSNLRKALDACLHKGGVKEKDFKKQVKKNGGNEAWLLKILKRGESLGWTWDFDDAHGRYRISNVKKHSKAA